MKIALAGATGKMGLAIQQEAYQSANNFSIISLSRQDNLSEADAVIDFTRPERTLELAAQAAAKKIPFISGTTGLSANEQGKLASFGSHISIVWSANMSIGVNVLLSLVEQAAGMLGPDYDIEISEMHHRHKVDAPSGTALALGRAAADGREIDFGTHAILSREGQTGPRPEGAIGFATLRGGSVVGDHQVIFAGEHDRIELSHYSQDRRIYARGALTAALWAQGRKPGFYSMKDVIAG